MILYRIEEDKVVFDLSKILLIEEREIHGEDALIALLPSVGGSHSNTITFKRVDPQGNDRYDEIMDVLVGPGDEFMTKGG